MPIFSFRECTPKCQLQMVVIFFRPECVKAKYVYPERITRVCPRSCFEVRITDRNMTSLDHIASCHRLIDLSWLTVGNMIITMTFARSLHRITSRHRLKNGVWSASLKKPMIFWNWNLNSKLKSKMCILTPPSNNTITHTKNNSYVQQVQRKLPHTI